MSSFPDPDEVAMMAPGSPVATSLSDDDSFGEDDDDEFIIEAPEPSPEDLAAVGLTDEVPAVPSLSGDEHLLDSVNEPGPVATTYNKTGGVSRDVVRPVRSPRLGRTAQYAAVPDTAPSDEVFEIPLLDRKSEQNFTEDVPAFNDIVPAATRPLGPGVLDGEAGLEKAREILGSFFTVTGVDYEEGVLRGLKPSKELGDIRITAFKLRDKPYKIGVELIAAGPVRSRSRDEAKILGCVNIIYFEMGGEWKRGIDLRKNPLCIETTLYFRSVGEPHFKVVDSLNW